MKILAIDDQHLILMSIEKKFKALGYDVFSARSGKEGITQFEKHQPDLVMVDINMDDMSGLEVVRHIRKTLHSEVPIIVLSGNEEEATVLEGFDLGINDYMKKPMSLTEVAVRIKRILGLKKHPMEEVQNNNALLHKHCVGVVVPCYNEAERLEGIRFADFAQRNPGYHLCFVNDGSKDNTLEVLQKLEAENKDFISVVNCEKNGGKAEAVRQGMQHLLNDPQFDYVGFLDADLSTDFQDFKDLVNTLAQGEYKIVSGSRIDRMGAEITKEGGRAIISKTINLIIQKILGMRFMDTQCGAKVMDKTLARNVFEKSFISRWLFDVEIFIRIKNVFGKEEAPKYICEQPLKRWIHMDGSKLSMKDSIKIVGQLTKIAMHYNG